MDQREITIQSYQTTVLFDLEALKAGIDSAWLTPQIPFGVFAHDRAKDHDSLSVVLGRVTAQVGRVQSSGQEEEKERRRFDRRRPHPSVREARAWILAAWIS